MLLALAGLAQAGEDECVACCKAAGLSGCRTSLRMYGEGSVATPEGGAWRVMGLWFLDCDGAARFEAGSTAVVADMPVSGELLLTGTHSAAFHCFTQACSYPEEACFDVMPKQRLKLVDCEDGAAMTALQLAQGGPPPPGSETIIAVIGDKPLVVAPVQGALVPHPVPPSGERACCNGGLFGHSVPASSAVVTQSRPGASHGSPEPPSTSEAWAGARDGVVLVVPAPPLSPDCGTAEVLRTESKRRVEVGNEATLHGELQTAVDEYRAALTLDPCNPYAWADLGSVAMQLGMVSEAAIALAQAVELQPRHYTAHTNLGLAYEALGQYQLAYEAFEVALALRPHHQPAKQGLERVSRDR
jgi:hypothetical protein